ncbi:MAG TPA: hypothetical protein VE135_05690 [Pyrinomonadaceae bacterium]|nr:hypothetical protein [Pyrinomonadaceae bacterium]
MTIERIDRSFYLCEGTATTTERIVDCLAASKQPKGLTYTSVRDAQK